MDIRNSESRQYVVNHVRRKEKHVRQQKIVSPTRGARHVLKETGRAMSKLAMPVKIATQIGERGLNEQTVKDASSTAGLLAGKNLSRRMLNRDPRQKNRAGTISRFRRSSFKSQHQAKTGSKNSQPARERLVRKRVTAKNSVSLPSRVLGIVKTGGSKIGSTTGMVIAAAGTPVLVVTLSVVTVVTIILCLVSFLFAGSDTTRQEQVTASMGDDYPWADQVRDAQGRATSVYNTVNPSTSYYYGNCTDFVFWRVNRDMGGSVGHWVYTHASLTPAGGSGGQWGNPDNMPGWTVVKDVFEISVGDVISYQPNVFGSDPSYGHVAYIASVSSAGITVENYGFAQYYVTSHDHKTLQDWLNTSSVVVRHNPSLTAEKRAEVGEKNSSKITAEAAKHLGKPYVWGGNGPGVFDCSGLTKYVYRKAGITLPRTAHEQFMQVKNTGRLVANINALSPGDLVFFAPGGRGRITHVGIATGAGQMIHAAMPGRGVVKEPIYSDFVGGGRP